MNAVTSPERAQVAAATGRSLEYLTCRLGGEDYGIDILKVQEIRGYEAPTRIANAPDFIKGVLNLRGVIVPVLDLRMTLTQAPPAYDGTTVTIILNVAKRVVGVVVDSVSDVIELRAEAIKPPPAFNERVDAGFITGLAPVAATAGQPERMLVLVDIEQLVSSADMGLVSAADSLH